MRSETIQTVTEIVPDRPLSSLYDVACLYTACDMYDRLTSEYVDWDLSPEALRVMSPKKLESLFDPEAEYTLIAARVDVSGDTPKLGDQPVTIENLTEDLQYKTGFMSRDKTYKQTDYSISNYSNGDDVETLAHDTWGNRFLRGRLERWPFEVSDELVENSPLLQNLRTLGDDAEAMERLEEALLNQAPFDETEAIVTVKIRQEPDGEYLYPGEIPALNRAGVENRYEHLRDGLSVDEAHGPGTGYVSGEEGEVLGGSGGIRGQYSKLQTGPFPNLQSDDAWLSRPLTEAQAVAISNFDDFITDFSFTRQGVRLHYLPYPVQTVDEEIFERFHSEVYTPLRDASEDEFIDRVVDVYTAEVRQNESAERSNPLADVVGEVDTYQPFAGRDTWLRLYGLMYVGATDPARVFIDEPNVRLDALTRLEDAYVDALSDVGSTSQFGTLVSQLGYYLPVEGALAYSIMFGSFFGNLTSKSPDPGDEADENQRATADDALFSRYARILRNKPIETDKLLEEYALRVEQERRENLSEGREPAFPTRAVLGQYIQLRSLAAAELLTGENIISRATGDMYMSAQEANTVYQSRDERLADFIQSHPMLEDAETRSVFLLGALVGRIAAYQYSDDVSQKLTEQYPPSAVNRRSLPDITQDVLDRNYTYGDKEDIARFNRRYTDRLTDSMLMKRPDDWELSESETKWIYSLGIAYGKQDTGEGIESEDGTDTETAQ
jgi:hypothetical protein